MSSPTRHCRVVLAVSFFENVDGMCSRIHGFAQSLARQVD